MTTMSNLLKRFRIGASRLPLVVVFLAAGPALANDLHGTGDDVLSQFFNRLKTITDDGRLFDIAATSEHLDISLHEEPTALQPDLELCTGKEGAVGARKIKIVSDQRSWYRNLPTGVPNMPVPGFIVNLPSGVGDATLKYEIRRVAPCGNRPAFLGDEANLEFAGLPSFTCITYRDVRKYLPEAKPANATDGVSVYTYHGSASDETGTYASFTFRLGADCAVSANIVQSQKLGNRFLRARAQYQNCVVKAEQEACVNRNPASGYVTLLDQLRAHSIAVCGALADFYEQEPAQGSMPDVILDSGNGSGTLCGRKYW